MSTTQLTNSPAATESGEQPVVTPRRPVLRFIKRRLEGWMLRHQLAFNFWIHMLGIPIAVASLPLLCLGEWQWALGAFVLGYLLQWIGHRAEGNDVGEWAAIKRMLGLPYVGISPRWNPADPNRL